MNSTNLPSNSGTALVSAPERSGRPAGRRRARHRAARRGRASRCRPSGHRRQRWRRGAGTGEACRAFDLMICDIRLPKMDGLTLFRQTRQQSPDTTIILMTAFAAVQDAVAAVKEGAHDYLTKPFEIDEITLRVKRIAEHRALLRELEVARAELAKEGISEVIVGRSVQMLRLLGPGQHDRAQPRARPAAGRERHRQGAGRARAARARRPPRQGVRRRQLCRLPRDAAGSRAVRTRAGRLHGRGEEARRALPRRARRDAAARRGGRDVAAGAGEAAARAAGGRDRAARHQRVGAGGRARHLGDQPQPQGAGQRGPVSRGPLLPAERPQHRHPAAARAQGRPAAAGAVLPQEARKDRQRRAPPLAGGVDGAVAVPVPGQRAPAGARHPARGGAGRGHATSTSSTCRATSRTRATWCWRAHPCPAPWAPR